MARLLFCSFVFLHAGGGDHHTTAAAALVQVVLVALVVAAVVVSLCTSSAHAKLWRRQQRGAAAASAAPLVKAETEEEIEAGRSGRKQRLGASLSGIGGRAAAVAKMVSWRKKDVSRAGSEEEEDYEEEEAAAMEDEAALWRKGIIMGEKCRPLQFSGNIAFDSAGNPLPPLAPPPPAVKKVAGDNPLPPPPVKKVAGDNRAKN